MKIIRTMGTKTTGGLCLWAWRGPRTSPAPECVCAHVHERVCARASVCVRHLSPWQAGACLLNDVGVYLWSDGRRVGGRGKSERGGEIETAWGCDIKISSRWWMSVHTTLERSTKTKKRKKAAAQWMTSRIWTCASVFPCVFHNDSECVVASVVFGDFCVH